MCKLKFYFLYIQGNLWKTFIFSVYLVIYYWVTNKHLYYFQNLKKRVLKKQMKLWRRSSYMHIFVNNYLRERGLDLLSGMSGVILWLVLLLIEVSLSPFDPSTLGLSPRPGDIAGCPVEGGELPGTAGWPGCLLSCRSRGPLIKNQCKLNRTN